MTTRLAYPQFLLLLCLVALINGQLLAQVDPIAEITQPSDSGYFRGVAEKDGCVFTLSSWHDFSVYDARTVSVNGPFVSLSTFLSRRQTSHDGGLLRNGNLLYVYGNGFQVFDISNPANPVDLGSVPGPRLRNMGLSGNHLLATGNDFLGIYSISDPAHPALLASMTLNGRTGFCVARFGEYLYVGEFQSSPATNALRIARWDGASTLTTANTIMVPAVPYQLFVRGSYLFDCRSGYIILWRLGADPTQPARVDSDPWSGRAAAIWGDKLITNGRVYQWHGSDLNVFSNFVPGGAQIDGFPHGAVATSDFIYLTQSARILILRTPPTLVFPQQATGETAGFTNRSRLVLRNCSATPAAGVVRYRNSDGTAASVRIGGTAKTEVGYAIPAWGSTQIVTDGTGSLVFGPVEVRSSVADDCELQGTLIFDLLGSSVSVQAEPLRSTHQAFVTVAADENTGVALYNPSLTTEVSVEARLLDKNGVQRGETKTLRLTPLQQLSVFVTETALFASYLQGVEQFEGTLHLRVTVGGPVSVVSLIQKKSSGALMAVPTTDIVFTP